MSAAHQLSADAMREAGAQVGQTFAAAMAALDQNEARIREIVREELNANPRLDTAPPADVARVLCTTEAGLAQMRYRGTGPKFIRMGGRTQGKVLYRWSDVSAYLDAHTVQQDAS